MILSCAINTVSGTDLSNIVLSAASYPLHIGSEALSITANGLSHSVQVNLSKYVRVQLISIVYIIT